MKKHYKIAALSGEEVQEIQDLEKEMGVHIMAFEPEKTLATLGEEEIQRINGLEEKLGVVLLVYES